jgi:hypothetical protein
MYHRFFSEVEMHSVTSLQDVGNATVKLRDASSALWTLFYPSVFFT